MPAPHISAQSWIKYKEAKKRKIAGEGPYGDLPVNIKTFLDTFVGETSPITEKNFTPEELNFINDTYQKVKARNARDEARYQKMLDDHNNGLAKILTYERINGELVDTSEKELQSIRDKLGSYKRTRGKTSITYKDYGGNKIGEDAGWTEQLASSFTDPSYRIATTLGRFNVEEDNKGNVYVRDTYDWTNPEGDTLDYFKAIPKAITSTETLGNLIMRGLRPKTAREVNIKLPSTAESRQHNSNTLIDSGLYRSDGSLKGTGFFGEIPMKNGGMLSEVTIKNEIEGMGEPEMPAVVPTLSKEELAWLAEGHNVAKRYREDRHPIAVNIVGKASDHYRKRIKEGKSPYWQKGEKVFDLPE